MQESEILQNIHILYENDQEYPEITSEDYLIRRALTKEAIDVWKKHNGVRWEQLFSTLDEAADGDKTTNGTDTQFDAPTNFDKMHSAAIKTDTLGWTFIKVRDIQLWENSGNKYCYITGLSGAKKINFSSAPETGQTIKYEYIKTPTYLTAPTSVTEMSNPFFIVRYVTAQCFGITNPAGYTLNLTVANDLLEQMAIENEQSETFQEDGMTDLREGFGV